MKQKRPSMFLYISVLFCCTPGDCLHVSRKGVTDHTVKSTHVAHALPECGVNEKVTNSNNKLLGFKLRE